MRWRKRKVKVSGIDFEYALRWLGQCGLEAKIPTITPEQYRDIRQRMGIQSKLASTFGIAQKQISDRETGKTAISQSDTMARLQILDPVGASEIREANELMPFLINSADESQVNALASFIYEHRWIQGGRFLADHFRSAQEPTSAESLRFVAICMLDCHLTTEAFDLATNLLTKAVEQGDLEATFHLGRAYSEAGDRQQAIQHFLALRLLGKKKTNRLPIWD